MHTQNPTYPIPAHRAAFLREQMIGIWITEDATAEDAVREAFDVFHTIVMRERPSELHMQLIDLFSLVICPNGITRPLEPRFVQMWEAAASLAIRTGCPHRIADLAAKMGAIDAARQAFWAAK